MIPQTKPMLRARPSECRRSRASPADRRVARVLLDGAAARASPSSVLRDGKLSMRGSAWCRPPHGVRVERR